MIPHAVAPAPSWVSTRDACAMLAVSRQRIHQFRAAGRLKAVQYGPKLFLWDRHELEAFALIPRPSGPRKTAGNNRKQEA